jgi:TRAP-type mannitol/chloroaromatic compound transport system permease small subunit
MKRFLAVIDRINQSAGWSVSWLGLLIMGLTLWEVISRFVFNKATLWAHGGTLIAFGFYIMLTGGYVSLHDLHVRVDILWSRWSSKRKAIADLVMSLLGFLFVGVILWASVPWAWESFLIRERSITTLQRFPVYPVKLAIALGAFLLLIQLVAKFIRDIYKAKGREASERGND